MIKAVAGGGGRGMRPVTDAAELEATFERCASEAKAAFGNGDLYVERFLTHARHIEVQVVGDGETVSHLWDRECSLQRQRQKVVEIAPADMLPPALREQLLAAAVSLGEAAGYRSLGTMEFLVGRERFVFIEGNARLQVEHTVTEEVTGLDLVRVQLEIADGRSLRDLGLAQADVPPPRGHAVQVRVNLETMAPDGSAEAGRAGCLTVFEPPIGAGDPGRRVRLRGVPDEDAVRQPAGQADRPACRDRRGQPRHHQGLPGAGANSASKAPSSNTKFRQTLLAQAGGERRARCTRAGDQKLHMGDLGGTPAGRSSANSISTPPRAATAHRAVAYPEGGLPGGRRRPLGDPGARQAGGRSACGRCRAGGAEGTRRRARRCKALVIAISVDGGAEGARWPAADDHGSHEDGACDRRRGGGHRAPGHRGGGRDGVRGPSSGLPGRG